MNKPEFCQNSIKSEKKNGTPVNDYKDQIIKKLFKGKFALNLKFREG